MRLHLLTIPIVLCGAGLAHAQPAGAQAEVLFRQGITLKDEGKFGEACAAFDASAKLEPAITTLLNRADCREQNGQLATAWGLFLDAERQTRAATDPPTQQLHLVAIEHAAKLEPRLSRLTVKVPDDSQIPQLEILRGAVPVDVGAWNHPLPVDGGNYTITARAPGYEPWHTTIEVAPEGDTQEVVVPTLERAPIVPDPVPRRRAKLPFVLGGAAVALLGSSVALGLSADGTYGDAKREPDDARQRSLWHTANTKRYVAEGLAIGGLACAGLAVWRYLRHGTVESRSQLELGPVAGRGTAGVQLRGHF